MGEAQLEGRLAQRAIYTALDLDRLYQAMREDKKVLREFGRVAAKELLGNE